MYAADEEFPSMIKTVFVTSENLTAVPMKGITYWNVMLCSVVEVYQFLR
jgi:hypothetical protein